MAQASGDATTFETLFGTPHGVDLVALATAYSVEHVAAHTTADLDAVLSHAATGVRLVEVRTRRDDNAALHERLREAAAAALA
jgi:2-succinyl-5-enolpyruvyl-6-hydroxy-3-cyclohexene-1-carboxylate synthase